jgi:putative endonuclease
LNNKQLLGRAGEIAAEKVLIKLGHTILFRNYKTKFGEIDIVSQLKNIVYLVEVKTSSNIRIENSPYSKWVKVQKNRLIKCFTYNLESQISPYSYSELKIIFIWFAIDSKNELKLVYFNDEIEIDYG